MKYLSSIVLCMMCSATFANSTINFENLKQSKTLDKACTQDDTDVFEVKTYQLKSGKVQLKTYSCTTEKQGKTQYYSGFGLQLASGQMIYFYDHLSDAIGYVGVSSQRVDQSTVVFDNMYERGGDLVFVWMQDEQHIYASKVPYMASDEGGIKISAQDQKIYLQKQLYLGENKQQQAQYKKIGQGIVLKKQAGKGMVYLSGDLKKFQQEHLQ